MRQTLSDLRYAVRQLWRHPGVALTAVLTLAIGMGVNVVAFGVVNGLLFKGTTARGLPGVGRIATTPSDDEGGHASIAERDRFIAATRGALEVAAEGRASLAWRHDGTTDTAWVLFVSRNYFTTAQVPVLAGRLDVSRRAGDPPTAVVGERFWRERLGGASLAGLTVRLNNRDAAVAGVVPAWFTGPAGMYSPDLWLALDDLLLFDVSPALQQPDTRWLFLFGRIAPEASLSQVQAALDVAAGEMARDWPGTHANRGAAFWMLDRGNSELRGVRRAAAGGMGIIGLVLLLACFNVANVLLARVVERERELGIRAAVGAGPSRLVRLVVAEGVVVAVLAGLLALLVASWTQAIVRTFAIPIAEPQHVDLSIDRRLAAFVVVLVSIAAIVPALWPAFSARRLDVIRALGAHGGQGAGGRTPALRSWLVCAQVAGATAFLCLAALLLQTNASLAANDLGFDPHRLVVAEFEPASHGFDAARTRQYLDLVAARTAALPGVTAVALADRAPFFIGEDRRIEVSPASSQCSPGGCRTYARYAVSEGYFAAMGIALVEGRAFTARAASGEAIVNQALAEELAPGGSVIGSRVRVGSSGTLVTIVGIARDSRTRSLDRVHPVLYVPLSAPDLAGALTLVAQTSGPAAEVVRPLRAAALAVDPNVAMRTVTTMAERTAIQRWPFETMSRVLWICGMLALALAMAGLAGVVSHSVSRRTREFGVRLAIGATPRDLLLDVLRAGGRLLGPGLLVGLAGAAVLAELARAVLVGIDALHPLAYLSVGLLQAGLVLIACLWPALRAARIDPLASLRVD